MALTGTLLVRDRMRTRWRQCRAVVVRANTDHEIDASGAFVVIVYVGTESTLAAAIVAHLRSDLGIVPDDEVRRWRRVLGDLAGLDSSRVKRWATSAFLRTEHSSPVDSRVDRVIRLLRDQPLGRRATSLVQLSKVAGLSPSRFGHVFTASMGIPLRPYMRWLRLQRAARELASGRSATHAAHLAGFADAAHLTRTFRRLLGATPRDLIARASRTTRIPERIRVKA